MGNLVESIDLMVKAAGEHRISLKAAAAQHGLARQERLHENHSAASRTQTLPEESINRHHGDLSVTTSVEAAAETYYGVKMIYMTHHTMVKNSSPMTENRWKHTVLRRLQMTTAEIFHEHRTR